MTYKKIHFIGLGGIGISALARWYKENGSIVTGEDDAEGEVTDGLIEEGVKINFPVTGEMLDESYDLVVHTIAIPKTHKALVKAEQLSIKILTYPEALGEMSKQKRMIAICGTHGKTTTTAMTYYALQAAGIDASMIVGSLIKSPQPPLNKGGDNLTQLTNYIHGKSEWLVVETCEYRRSFLNYNPEIIILTNIDNDHQDYFKTPDDTKKAFQEFVDKLKPGGTLISHPKYLEMLEVGEGVLTLPTSPYKGEEIKLKVPGEHNRQNASLVFALGNFLNLDKAKVLEGLSEFPGTWRRQEYKGDLSGLKMYDDYAHHPTEIKVTIEAFKEKFPNKKILVTFQPHLYSRTKFLFDDFVSSLTLADEVFLLPIYAAREVHDETVNSEMLRDSLNLKNPNKAKYFEDLESLVEAVKNYANKSSTILLNLGAGDAYKMFEILK
jgi:UDP-N-acetylmuramate--alanine ligase